MKKSIQQFALERKEQVDFRTDQNCAEFGSQQLSQSPVVYEIVEKFRAVAHGCLALIHQITVQSSLYDTFNSVPVGDSSQNDFGKKRTGIIVPGNPVFFLFDKRHAKE